MDTMTTAELKTRAKEIAGRMAQLRLQVRALRRERAERYVVGADTLALHVQERGLECELEDAVAAQGLLRRRIRELDPVTEITEALHA